MLSTTNSSTSKRTEIGCFCVFKQYTSSPQTLTSSHISIHFNLSPRRLYVSIPIIVSKTAYWQLSPPAVKFPFAKILPSFHSRREAIGKETEQPSKACFTPIKCGCSPTFQKEKEVAFCHPIRFGSVSPPQTTESDNCPKTYIYRPYPLSMESTKTGPSNCSL